MRSFATSAPTRADINVYSEDGQLVVAIDILGTYSTPQYLEDMRALLLQRSAVSKPLYLLLVQPSGLYLWRGEEEPGTKPVFASTRPIHQRIVPKCAARGWEASGDELRLLISSWLDHFTLGGKPDLGSEADQLLVRSGVYERIRNGDVDLEFKS